MVPTDQYLCDISLTASRYYTNAKLDAHEDEIDASFFTDGWLNTLAYDRGALYFAQLNGMIRGRTHGRRSIDDLVRIMVRKSRNGEEITDETWLTLIRQEIGEAAVSLTRSMLNGGRVIPPSDAYGPCFRRYLTTQRRYELGFTVKRGAPGAPMPVTDLVPASEAAKAGLQNGDQVVLPLMTSEGQRRDPQATVTAQVMRGDRTFSLTWLPRGEVVGGVYQWARVPGVPDQECRPPSRSPL